MIIEITSHRSKINKYMKKKKKKKIRNSRRNKLLNKNMNNIIKEWTTVVPFV